MKKIIFLRPAPYFCQLSGKSLYQSFDEIGLQKAQLHILKPTSKTKRRIAFILKKYKPNKIFCSQLLHSQETAKLFSKDIIIASSLNEIKFSMYDFSLVDDLPNNKVNPKRINRIRYQFSQALIRDRLHERKKHIIKRMLRLTNFIKTSTTHGTIICCSHSFIMKLYENLFRLNGQIDNFETLISLHNWKNPPFKSLRGFVVTYQNDIFHVVRI